MTSRPSWVRYLLLAGGFLLLPIASIRAQDAGGEPRRVRGIIDKDQTWSGRVLITDDVAIAEGVVTVLPGTLVEFAGEGWTELTVGDRRRPAGRIILNGTADAPIVFRGSRDRPSVITVFVHGPEARSTNVMVNGAEAARQAMSGFECRHVRFEHLWAEGRAAMIDPPLEQSASLSINFCGAQARSTLEDCVFERSNRLTIDGSPGGSVELSRNKFSEPRERAAVEVRGNADEPAALTVGLRDNRFAGAVAIYHAKARVEQNISIGDTASLLLDSCRDARVIDNQVHNTARREDGSYCLSCEGGDVVVQDNIFRGGTDCVLTGGKRMAGNVLIATAMESRVGRDTHTQRLVAALPRGAVFEDNLLLGPAHSMLVPQPMTASSQAGESSEATIIRNNVFDGFSKSARAIHLSAAGHEAAPVEVYNNLFLRGTALFFSEGPDRGALRYTDYNASAPPPQRVFDRIEMATSHEGGEGSGLHDVRGGSITTLELEGPIPASPVDILSTVTSARTNPAALRDQLRSLYRPRPSSPLVAKGRPVPGEKRGTIGFAFKAPGTGQAASSPASK